MAGSWKSLTGKHVPAFGASTMLLLTDGRVLCQEVNSTSWFALTPDSYGRYDLGTWSAVASAKTPRLYYASALLRDGRVFVAGGEYAPNSGDDSNSIEIYDPVANTWTQKPPPAGWDQIGDAPCCLLADGRLLIGNINDTRTAIYDPVGDAWSATGAKGDRSSEETWTLLRDGSVLTVDCNPPTNPDGSFQMASQRYRPETGTWVDAGSTAVDLVDHDFSTEMGPAVLLPNGHVIAFGGNGHTAVYAPPSSPAGTGTWSAGPDLPNGSDGVRMTLRDGPAALLPNGKVLSCGGLGTQGWGGSTSFVEYDPATNTLAVVGSPPNSNHHPFEGRMLLLPTGQVLYTTGAAAAYLYTPDGVHSEKTEPAITGVDDYLMPGDSYRVDGRRFNGMSQAVSYGDDCSAATNYPLARLEYEDETVVYCRTRRHSTMGVATGPHVVHTIIDVPPSAPPGEAELFIVANGVPSDPREVTVLPDWWVNIPWAQVWEILIGSLADGPLWVIGPDGKPHPVPPLGPDRMAKEAAGALRAMVNSVVQLRELGRELQVAQFQAAAEALRAGAGRQLKVGPAERPVKV
jgi:hypothetical protein